jgi:alkylation response protein AidB-like acyl-CoA dehydrogenase
MNDDTAHAAPLDFGYGADEALLRDQARKYLDEHANPDNLRRLLGRDPAAVYARGELPGYEESVWQRCAELGWSALAVPENRGGIGAKMAGIVGLVEEVGRHAFVSPLLPTLISTCTLRCASSLAAQRWCHIIAAGSSMSLAMTPRHGSWELGDTEVVATKRGGQLVLNGAAFFVQDAFKVASYLVCGRGPDGLYLAVVRRDAPGLSVARDHVVDLTRDQGHLIFTDVAVPEPDVVSSPSEALDVLRRAWPSVLTLVSADLVGASEWLLKTSVEYAKVRRQFDRTIGFFQAVKHPLVNAMMEIDLARSHLYGAACASDTDPDRAEIPARMAKSAASDAAGFVSGRAVQLHGGIGFTWECDVHFFFKRSMHNQALYGDGMHHRKKLAELIIGPVVAR